MHNQSPAHQRTVQHLLQENDIISKDVRYHSKSRLGYIDDETAAFRFSHQKKYLYHKDQQFLRPIKMIYYSFSYFPGSFGMFIIRTLFYIVDALEKRALQKSVHLSR